MEGGAASISSATLGLSVETECREASSVSDSRCGEGDLVFESEVVSAGTGSGLERSGVFDGGGGVGFPLSS